MRRRDFLKALAACSAWPAGCTLGEEKGRFDHSKISGTFVQPNPIPGHAVRSGSVDWKQFPESGSPYDVVIVGGGVGGLSAAWKLRKSGIERIVLFELNPTCGGTSRARNEGGTLHPWGAHYINIPPQDAACVHEVLCDIGVIEGYDARNWPLVEPGAILHWPHERLFIDGHWQEGIEPLAGASKHDQEQIYQFRDRMLRMALRRGRDGRRAFALPLRASSADPALRQLDQISMEEYLRSEGLESERLRWYVNYGCRDDYGSLAHQVSAWAGIHYFACRAYDYRLQDTYPSHTLTWPDGNGRLVRGLLAGVESEQVQTDQLVVRIEDAGDTMRIAVLDVATGAGRMLRAKTVIYAGKLHAVPYVFTGLGVHQHRALRSIVYSPWLVAALQLKAGSTYAVPTWDSVLYDSPSLGYIKADHGNPQGDRQTLVYYLPFVEGLDQARSELLRANHSQWVEWIVQDLGRAEPQLVEEIERIDIYRWGHAMVRPSPGFIWGPEHTWRQKLPGPAFLACAERTGLPLFEEALYSGILAAEEAMGALGHAFPSSLQEG